MGRAIPLILVVVGLGATGVVALFKSTFGGNSGYQRPERYVPEPPPRPSPRVAIHDRVRENARANFGFLDRAGRLLKQLIDADKHATCINGNYIETAYRHYGEYEKLHRKIYEMSDLTVDQLINDNADAIYELADAIADVFTEIVRWDTPLSIPMDLRANIDAFIEEFRAAQRQQDS